MPQFDTFIFSSILFYFIIFFFIYLYYNFNTFLPRLSSILKLRYKLLEQKSNKQQQKTNVYIDYIKFPSQISNQKFSDN